ncbi:hypothetical protein [Burkholderia sp. BCC0405]|uniref:hypothetical protein n=1 Tax=Burkholderia sp. BCC0405 TaxID=2676298 RepID=UPI00158A0AD4|nr:hypothetical protein [Burkholderia sp. BCC0405]
MGDFDVAPWDEVQRPSQHLYEIAVKNDVPGKKAVAVRRAANQYIEKYYERPEITNGRNKFGGMQSGASESSSRLTSVIPTSRYRRLNPLNRPLPRSMIGSTSQCSFLFFRMALPK